MNGAVSIGGKVAPRVTSRLQSRTLPDYAEPIAGMSVGEWILEARVGRGATGEVWRARHSVWSERVVAIKFATNPEYLNSIRHDGLIRADLSRMDSPHLVKVLGLNILANPPYLMMEYVAGSTLRDRLRDSRKLQPLEALRVLEGVLKGLVVAHTLGIVHRDLKPENVLLDAEGTARLTDFSVAAQVVGEESLRHSLGTDDLAAQSIAGTLVYMAPEQRQGARADARSDVYALGVLLFEMLTGELPQPGDRISDYATGIPEPVEELFAQCFTRPERRFASAREMLEAVHALRKAGGRTKSSTTGSLALPPSAARKLGKVRPVLSTRDMPERPDSANAQPADKPHSGAPVFSTRDMTARRAAKAFEETPSKGAVAKSPDSYQASESPRTTGRDAVIAARPTGIDDLERLIAELPEDVPTSMKPETSNISKPTTVNTHATAPGGPTPNASNIARRGDLPPLKAIYQQRELAPAMAAYANGDYRRAADEFRKVVEAKPGNPAARRGLAMSLYLSGRPKESLAIYGGLVSRREDTAEVWNNIGVISLNLGRLREAERAFLRAIELKPRYAPAYSNLAGVYQRLGKPDLARTNAKIALDIDPENLAASFNMTM